MRPCGRFARYAGVRFASLVSLRYAREIAFGNLVFKSKLGSALPLPPLKRASLLFTRL